MIDEGKSNRHVAVTSEWGYKGLSSLGVCCLSASSGAEGLEVSEGRLCPLQEEAALVCATQLPGRRWGRASPDRLPLSLGGPAVSGSWGLRASAPQALVQGLLLPWSCRHERTQLSEPQHLPHQHQAGEHGDRAEAQWEAVSSGPGREREGWGPGGGVGRQGGRGELFFSIKITFSLRYNVHTIKFTILKYTVQWVLGYLEGCAPIAISSRPFPSPVSHHSLCSLPPTPSNH